MSAFKALELVITQASLERDAQMRRYAQAQRTLQHAQGQLDQLQSYAGDTDVRWTRGQAFDLSAELVRHHYQFVGKLQNAIHLQTGVLANLQRQLDAAHQRLVQAEARVASFKQVLKKRQAAQRLQQGRQEQRATDAFAALRHRRDATSAITGDMP